MPFHNNCGWGRNPIAYYKIKDVFQNLHKQWRNKKISWNFFKLLNCHVISIHLYGCHRFEATEIRFYRRMLRLPESVRNEIVLRKTDQKRHLYLELEEDGWYFRKECLENFTLTKHTEQKRDRCENESPTEEIDGRTKQRLVR